MLKTLFISTAFRLDKTLQPSLKLLVGDTLIFFIFEFVRKSSKINAIVLFEKFIVFFKLVSSPNEGQLWKRKPLLKGWSEVPQLVDLRVFIKKSLIRKFRQSNQIV